MNWGKDMDTRAYMKDYHYMTDAQRRALCRKKMARRRREVRRNIILCFTVSLILMVILCSLLIGKFTSRAAEMDSTSIKYYAKVELSYGETLSEVASDYMDAHYASMNEYLDEVAFINHMEDPDHVPAGTTIILPYYSSDFLQ
ncbi:MAG: hypothetical protein K6A92_02365 [Lachnospiraceae bacterium]|nr:hypothetical protein [Lachnospiraceae bacterium]